MRATGPSMIETEDALALVRKQDVPVPGSMARKYGVDRESIFAVVSL